MDTIAQIANFEDLLGSEGLGCVGENEAVGWANHFFRLYNFNCRLDKFPHGCQLVLSDKLRP